VLGLIVTDTLFRKHPDLPEGNSRNCVRPSSTAVRWRGRPQPAPWQLRPAGQGRESREGATSRRSSLAARSRDRRRVPDGGMELADPLVPGFRPVIARSAQWALGGRRKTLLQLGPRGARRSGVPG
jgi:hypothetical protein